MCHTTAANTTAPPMIAGRPGFSANSRNTQSGESTTSSVVIRPASAAGMRRAPARNRKKARAIEQKAKAASTMRSIAVALAGSAKGDAKASENRQTRKLTGSMSSSRRTLTSTAMTAKDPAMTRARPSPSRCPAANDPETMIVTPARAMTAAIRVRADTASRSITQPSPAAMNGVVE